MIQVGLLTLEQKEEISGHKFEPGSYFYPIQDVDGNWIISIEEIEQCINPDFVWIKNISLIEYKPIENLDNFHIYYQDIYGYN